MRDKWKFWYSMCKDPFGMTFDGTAFKGKSEHGVRFTIQVGNDFLTIQTEASKTGYMLTDNFSSVIKGILGTPRFGPHAPPLGMVYTSGVLTTNWVLPDDKREKVIQRVIQFLKG